MGHYKHFTLEEREKLLLFMGRGPGISEIALALSRSRLTIYRELKRNFNIVHHRKRSRTASLFYLKRTAPSSSGRWAKDAVRWVDTGALRV